MDQLTSIFVEGDNNRRQDRTKSYIIPSVGNTKCADSCGSTGVPRSDCNIGSSRPRHVNKTGQTRYTIIK